MLVFGAIPVWIEKGKINDTHFVKFHPLVIFREKSYEMIFEFENKTTSDHLMYSQNIM